MHVSGRAALVLLVAQAPEPVSAAPDAAPALRIVVHPGVSGEAVTRQILADIYLGNVTRWTDGGRVVPVDQPAASPVRVLFSRSVLGMDILRVQQHWLALINRGRHPPQSRKGDREVVDFVARQPGAIGYVDGSFALPEGVKVLELR